MCTPAAIPAVISLAATAAGTGAQIAAQKRSASHQAAVQRNNAQLAGYERESAVQQSAAAAARAQQQGRRVASTARVTLGKAGVDYTTGTPADEIAEIQATSELDRARLRARAVRSAWAFDTEIDSRKSQARESERAGVLGALGSGLSGLGRSVGYGAEIYRTVNS